MVGAPAVGHRRGLSFRAEAAVASAGRRIGPLRRSLPGESAHRVCYRKEDGIDD